MYVVNSEGLGGRKIIIDREKGNALLFHLQPVEECERKLMLAQELSGTLIGI